MKVLYLIIMFAFLLMQGITAQTYSGTCWTLQRESNSDVVHRRDMDAIANNGTIAMGDLIFFVYDKELGIYLGIPISLLEKYDGKTLMQKTIDLYILDGSPPILQIHNMSTDYISFTLYLRGVEDERDFLIQSFHGVTTGKKL